MKPIIGSGEHGRGGPLPPPQAGLLQPASPPQPPPAGLLQPISPPLPPSPPPLEPTLQAQQPDWSGLTVIVSVLETVSPNTVKNDTVHVTVASAGGTA